MTDPLPLDLHAAKLELLSQARALGFGQLGVASVDIPEDEQHLLRWLEAGFHGEMGYMQRHGVLRSRPADLVPGCAHALSEIIVRAGVPKGVFNLLVGRGSVVTGA